MLPTYNQLREMLRLVILDKEQQGHDVEGLVAQLHALPDSYDALYALAERVANLPMRDGWPYVEPNDLEGIWAECDPQRPLGPMATVDLDDAERRVEAAFLGSVCGCILGKPLEVKPTLAEIRSAFEQVGDWPILDYVTEEALEALGRRHSSWASTVRGRISFVAPDDDINYTILGMLILEEYGKGFDAANVRDMWLRHLPITMTFGPERTTLVKAGISQLAGGDPAGLEAWASILNPGDERCGALIRADAYGYACPGQPALAAELAWRDAHWTHRRTGIYGAMFVAAALAAAQVLDDPLAVFQTALRFVPQRSRFYEIVSDCLNEVREASDWLDGYERIHRKYGRFAHCTVYQECGTLINTLRFAENVGDGICIQVSQGNDTDSYGATAGSLLGAFFGPGNLDAYWLAPFNDDIRTTLAQFYERSLSGLAARMAGLPRLLAQG